MPGRWRTGTTHLQSVVIDACWRPMAGDEAGDFHDIIDLKDGRVVVVVGDAPGFGPAAAAIAEDLRAELRRGFREAADVADVLRRLDVRLQEGGDHEVIATAACAVIDPHAGAVRVASAGHLPLVFCRGSTVELLHEPLDPPLGITTERRVVSRPLHADSTLFLYTDGLIERRGIPLDAALRSLVRACEELGSEGVRAPAFVGWATAEFGQPNDDATAVSVRLQPRGAPPPLPAPARRAPRERVAIRAYVDSGDLRSAALQDAIDDLARSLGDRLDVRVEVLDVKSAPTEAEAAGVLAAPTVVRVSPEPPVQAIGWFRSPVELARALQLPVPKEDA